MQIKIRVMSDIQGATARIDVGVWACQNSFSAGFAYSAGFYPRRIRVRS
jgi:hypothetical protein